MWIWLACGCTAGSTEAVGPAAPAGHTATAPSITAQAITAQAGDTAFTDVSVVPMASDGVLAHHTVVVRGDRIVAVAPRPAVSLPAGVRVIDGAGKWLMPGLADMHVHTWHAEDLTMFLAAGVTTIRNMWGVPQHLAWRSQIARGERLGPTIVTAGALLDGDPPDWPGSITITDPADAEPVVVAQQAAGYDFLKPVSRLSPEVYAALTAAAQRHGMVMSGHVALAVGLEAALAAHQHSIEHLDGYLAALVPPGVALPSADDAQPWMRAVLTRLDPARLPGLIAQTLAAGAWNCPTLIAYDRTPELYDGVAAIERRVRWLGLVPAAVRAQWARDFQAQAYSAEATATTRANNAELARILAALVAANAPILTGTDTGGAYKVPGEALHDELELMIAAGVPRPRALRAATADAWRYLGQPHEAGVIEVGARADLVLVTSDPLAAPLPLVPDGVMVRGRWLPRGELEARLAEIARHTAPPADRWNGAPPLAADGTPVRQARYDLAIAGTTVGQERLAIGTARGTRTIVGQIADFGEGVETAYQRGPQGVTVTASARTMTLAVAGVVTAGKLVVTGHDLSGKAVALSQPMPPGGFLSAPGIAGALALVDQLAGMRPGTKRTVTALALDAYPAVAITTIRYAVARKPDRGGQRVFAVATTQHGTTVTGELVVDAAGTVVAQTLDPPVATTITRRP
ncbi:MAG TPA: amidohydrolase family protein [Kofleriaceae bacterium]|nr:amidohydrolase family protein [Kofleriaceae bacterium]